ncbi:MAG: hypothetical protein QM808_06215 [Steroidobacteraceae bacterium]
MPLAASQSPNVRSARKLEGCGHFLAHDAADRAIGPRIRVFVVDADIADMREGESNDLPRVARVGHHFLISGHGGVEADFADCLADGAEALAPDYGPSARTRTPSLHLVWAQA